MFRAEAPDAPGPPGDGVEDATRAAFFADLRSALTTAAANARSAGKHLWPRDRSQDGLTVADQADLEQDGVIFPKLFRRLTEFLTEPQGGLGDFLGWLKKTEEQVVDLVANTFTHYDNVVSVTSPADPSRSCSSAPRRQARSSPPGSRSESERRNAQTGTGLRRETRS
jgi:hypothetical protein